MAAGVTSTYRFGEFEMRPALRQLLAREQPVAVGARAFDTLLALIERRERVVTKNELLELVWPGLVVEENNLQVQVSTLRKLLGPQAIATIPGRGYRFAAALSDDGGAADADAPGSGAAASGSGPAAGGVDSAAGDLTERGPRAEGRVPGTTVADGVVDAAVSTNTAPLPERSTNLPHTLQPLFGRDADVDAVRALIGAHRLVTIVGAGGIGKSRLAQAAAHAEVAVRRDGAWMVELAGLGDAALLANAIAQALQVALPGQRPAADELLDAIAGRELLLVLDNCEHLLAPIAELVTATLARTPGAVILATSQEPLHLPVEQQYRLLPLPVTAAGAGSASAADKRASGAIALLEARVRSANPRFRLDDHSLDLALDICRRLDGLPLAIEFAAARVATLGLRAVRDKLDARFKLLTGGARTTLRRHQTLRAALEWSHNLLDEQERIVFRRLGVFAGGFSMEAAQALVQDATLDEWAVLDILSALVDKSLVVADDGPVPRYRLLETARAFALEQLAGDETPDMLRRHALATLASIRRIDGANLDGELRTDEFRERMLPELDNMRAAHAWAIGEEGDAAIAVGLAAHAGSLIDYAIECAEWMTPLLPHVRAGALEPAVEARYWRAVTASNVTWHVPRPLQIEAAMRAKSLYAALGQPRRVLGCLIQLGRHEVAIGMLGEAHVTLDEARMLLQPSWPPEFHISLLRIEAYLARREGRRDDARALFAEGLEASKATGDWRLEVIARTNVVDFLWEVGPLERAWAEAVALVDSLHGRLAANTDTAGAYVNLIGILSELGRIDEAVDTARAGLPYVRRARSTHLEEWTYLCWRRGQLDTAAMLLGAHVAEASRTVLMPQVNELRLVAAARAGIVAGLAPDVLARAMETGARLDFDALIGLIDAALEQAASVHHAPLRATTTRIDEYHDEP